MNEQLISVYLMYLQNLYLENYLLKASCGRDEELILTLLKSLISVLHLTVFSLFSVFSLAYYFCSNS